MESVCPSSDVTGSILKHHVSFREYHESNSSLAVAIDLYFLSASGCI